jgi:hypothetical protein
MNFTFTLPLPEIKFITITPAGYKNWDTDYCSSTGFKRRMTTQYVLKLLLYQDANHTRNEYKKKYVTRFNHTDHN